MVTDTRIQEDVQTALLEEPRIDHPEPIAVPADIPAPPADSAMERLVSMLAPFGRVIQPKLYGLDHLPADGSLLVGNHTLYGLLDVPFLTIESGSIADWRSADLASTPTTPCRSGVICSPRVGWFAVLATTFAL